ncbi:MAG: GHMP family kinase ATP-binding protein [Gemmatimonadaceae bacterium]
MRSLVARAPTRIDFGGGWTDVPPYSEEEGGCVCSVAIAAHATVRLRRSSDQHRAGGGGATPHNANAGALAAGTRTPDLRLVEAALGQSGVRDVEVELRNDFPLGAGLGGSSAAGVAIAGALAAWRGESLDRTALAERSRATEVEELHVPGGRQDHYAAAYGGALALEFGGATRVRQLALSADLRRSLERRCIVAYTGQSRISGDTVSAVLDAYRLRDPVVLASLACMKRLATQMVAAVRRGDVDELGTLVGEHWVHQRALHPAIPTPLIDEILARARIAGALGGKALGASGGGCILVVAGIDNADFVRRTVAEMAQLVPVSIDESGFRWMAEE